MNDTGQVDNTVLIGSHAHLVGSKLAFGIGGGFFAARKQRHLDRHVESQVGRAQAASTLTCELHLGPAAHIHHMLDFLEVHDESTGAISTKWRALAEGCVDPDGADDFVDVEAFVANTVHTDTQVGGQGGRGRMVASRFHGEEGLY